MASGHGRADRSYVIPAHIQQLLKGCNAEAIKTWTIDEIVELASGDHCTCELTDRKKIASYNWDTGSNWHTPKIVVPGAPMEFFKWAGGDLSGQFNRPHPSVNQSEGLDAMLTAVRLLHPEFKIFDYDVVSSSGSISALFYICFKILNAIRIKRGAPPCKIDVLPSTNDMKLRINAQNVASTVLLIRQDYEWVPDIGVGSVFRTMSTKAPPASMLVGERHEYNSHKIVNEMRIGDLKILLAQSVAAALYPKRLDIENLGLQLEVAVAGYKSDQDSLTPIEITSRKIHQSALMHPGKWFNQHLLGAPYCYLGRHNRGIFDEPTLKSLDEIRDLCGLDESAAHLLVKVLKCVLNEIVTFARQLKAKKSISSFAIISNPDDGELTFHEYNNNKEAGVIDETKIISEETLAYLVSTLE